MRRSILYRIAICDDEWISLKEIEEMTKKVLDRQNIEHEIQYFQKAKDLENALLQTDRKYHLILMDICLGEENGIETIKKIREHGITIPLIYISGYDTYAMAAIETDVMRYLMKPIDEKKMEEAILTAYQRGYKKDYFFLEMGTENGLRKISYDDILYLEAYNRGTNIVTTSGILHIKKKFSQIAQEADAQFFSRCHHSFMVNKDKVEILKKYEIILVNQESVPVSRRRYDQCKKEFLDFLSDGRRLSRL